MTNPVDTDALRAPLPDNARMDAYYYGFDRTGIGAIDAILSAVAVAGKGAHHTESWGDDGLVNTYYYGSRASEGLVDGAATAVELIQFVANRSAEQVRAAADEIDALRARLSALEEDQDGLVDQHVLMRARARAERAEAAIAAAPHGQACIGRFGGACTCWKADCARASQPAADYTDEWCREEGCQYRNWRSGSMPTHKRGSGCPQPAPEVES